jgi:D-3-phosphoglycerate dehydrogenase
MTAIAQVGAGKTVVVGPVHYEQLCEAGRTLLLEAGFTLDENLGALPYEFSDLEPRLATADAAISGVELWNQRVFDAAPNLKIISRLGVGLDNIDLPAARAHGIDVVNVPGGNANAVAEIGIGLMLSVLRQIPQMNTKIRQGIWDRFVGSELTGKTIGLIGFGAIARELSERLRGFNVEILASDPYGDEELAAALGVTLTSFDEVVSRAEILSVHAPHIPATHHLINDDVLSRMRPGAILINTSRGGLVDEAALYRALSSGAIAGAGLDVFEVEPVTDDNPLLTLANVVATTHAAADSEQAYHRIGLATAQAIIDVFSGERPANLAN